MTLIAIEEHWMLPDLATALAAAPSPDPSLAFNTMGDHQERLEDIGAGRLAVMDEQGIDLAVLALSPPGTQSLPADEAVRLSRAANDTAARVVERYPDRFRAQCTVPLSSPTHAAAELERAAGLGHVGSMVYGRSGETPLDDPCYDEFFAAAAELHQPVFLHPQIPSPALRAASYEGFDELVSLGLATFGWGWHLDAATAALRLILRGTFDRHPDLQVVLGHWGEMLLFWTDRADSLARIAGLQKSVSDYLRSNFVITMSGMFNPALLAHALTVTSVDRLVFSTDYPFQHPSRDDITGFLDHFAPADRAKVMSGNAASLYGLSIPDAGAP